MSTSSSRRQPHRPESGSGLPTRQILIGAGAGLILVIIAFGVITLTGDDSAGAAFQPVDSIEHESSPNHVHGLGYDTENDRVFLATHFGLFARDRDGQLYQVGDIRDDLMGFAMNPNDPAEIYVSGHPVTGGNFGVRRSQDNGLTFEDVFDGVGNEVVDFHSMSVSASDPDWLYGMFGGQIYRTSDGGENWDAFAPHGLPEPGLCWGVPCLAAGSDAPETVYAGTGSGLMKSSDAGETWTVINDEIGQVAAVTVDSNNPNRLVAYTEQNGLAVSEDAGESFSSIHGDLPPVESTGLVYAIALDPDDDQRIYIGNIDNHVYETVDGGETWEQII